MTLRRRRLAERHVDVHSSRSLYPVARITLMVYGNDAIYAYIGSCRHSRVDVVDT